MYGSTPIFFVLMFLCMICRYIFLYNLQNWKKINNIHFCRLLWFLSIYHVNRIKNQQQNIDGRARENVPMRNFHWEQLCWRTKINSGDFWFCGMTVRYPASVEEIQHCNIHYDQQEASAETIVINPPMIYILASLKLLSKKKPILWYQITWGWYTIQENIAKLHDVYVLY